MIFIVSLIAMVMGVFINWGISYTTTQLDREDKNSVVLNFPFVHLNVSCDERTFFRWLTVEVLTFGFTIYAYFYLGWSFNFFAACFLIWIGLLIGTIDLVHHIIPNELSIINALGGFIYAGIFILNQGELTFAPLISVLIGGGFFFLLSVFSSMGGGDVKYMAGACLFLSPTQTLLGIFITFMAGGFASLFFILFKRAKWGMNIAFGPYLIIGVCLSFIFGNEWIQAYLEWVRL